MKEAVSKKQGVSSSPCAGCKLLRRRCSSDCIFAPHFPADDPLKFASVHRVFGASNVSKMLQDLQEQQRGDAVSSMVYEANARIRDPVYGCVGPISYMQQQIELLRRQLALAQAEVVHLRLRHHLPTATSSPLSNTGSSPYSSSSSSSYVFTDSKPTYVDHFDMMVVDDQACLSGSMWSSYCT